MVPTVWFTSSQALLAFRTTEGNYLHGKLTCIVCQWHYVSICLSIQQHPAASRGPERRNQYLLAVPSEELDFAIRSAHSHDSDIKHHNLTGHVMHRCSRLMKEIMLNSKHNKGKYDRSQEALWRGRASRWQANDEKRQERGRESRRRAFTFYYWHGYIHKWET